MGHNIPHTEESKKKISLSKLGKNIKSTPKSKAHIEAIRKTLRKGKYIPCSICGKNKYYSPSKIKPGKKYYCSQACNGKSNIGINNHKWKGGRSRALKDGYYTQEYKNWRKNVFERDEYTCLLCFKSNTYLVAHHILGFADYPDSKYDIDNGMTLCEECHKSIHFGNNKNLQEVYYVRKN